MKHPLNFRFFLVLLLCFGCIGAVVAQRFDPVDNSANGGESIRDSMKQFVDVYGIVEQNYADPVDPDKAIFDGAIPSMLRVLDPHSNFFDPKAYAQLREEQRGKYFGVGMSIGARGTRIIVIAPFPSSPAYKAGIRPGDVIAAVDTKTTESMTTQQVADMVRGPLGTQVEVTIARPGVAEPIRLTLTRAEIPHDSVDVYFMLRAGIGYVHISGFEENTDAELQRAMNDFGALNGLVLDLRDDPGGLLTQAVAVAGEFLPKGDVVVSQHGRSSPEAVYRAKQGNDGKYYPIVALVNGGSASAAEIVSGALQDHDRALLAGQDTFGKGLVQTVFPLSDETALALTTAKYYTPSGRLIQRNYTGVGLYDYYFNVDKKPDLSQREIRHTDIGRTVYGGNGITPDVSLPARKLNAFQQNLLLHYVFFDYAQQYLSQHQAGPGFAVDDAVLGNFREFLTSNSVPYTEADLSSNLDWVKSNIQSEILTNAAGLTAGQQAKAASDPEVLKALELMPQAKNLELLAQKRLQERVKTATVRKPAISN